MSEPQETATRKENEIICKDIKKEKESLIFVQIIQLQRFSFTIESSFRWSASYTIYAGVFVHSVHTKSAK